MSYSSDLGDIVRSLTPGWKFVLKAIWQGGQTVGMIFESGTNGKMSLICYCGSWLLLISLGADAEVVRSPDLASNSLKISGAIHMRESWLLLYAHS